MELTRGRLRPGLINAHDHLQLNHYARLGDPPYGNAYEWGRDIHARYGRFIRRAAALPRREAFLFGALKNLLGAVTTVVHHDPWDPVLARPFPIRLARVRAAHSLGFERDLAAALAGSNGSRTRPFSMHVAEGTDGIAAAEVRDCDARGLLTPDLLAVHLVAVDRDAVRRLRRAGAAAVWCPTSNRFLFRRSAPRYLFARGLDILLGTDSLLTAQGTMLDELRLAARLGRLSRQRLMAAVGATAARRLGLPPPGTAPGHAADLVLVRRPLLRATPRDVALVIVGGKPRLGDAEYGELFAYCGVAVESLSVGGVLKLVAAPLAAVALRVLTITPEAGRILA